MAEVEASRLSTPDGLSREGDILCFETTTGVRNTLREVSRSVLFLSLTDRSNKHPDIRKFYDWERTLALSDGGDWWYRYVRKDINANVVQNEPSDFSHSPFIVEDNDKILGVASFDMEADLLPGFVRSMFAAAQQATKTSSHQRFAVKWTAESSLRTRHRALRSIDYANQSIQESDTLLRTLTGEGLDAASSRILRDSWIGRTFELFHDHLGDPNQYHMPVFSTDSIK